MAQTATYWQKVLSVASSSLIVAGILLVGLSIALGFQRYNPHRLSFDFDLQEPVQVKAVKKDAPLPTRITISGTPINLPIVESTIHGQEWETTDKGVSYLSLSPIPGEKGNSILYGHNWTNLLGPLVNVVPGQLIRIFYADGSSVRFVVEGTAMVTPTDTSILLPSKEPLLTIYTCAGFFDSKRFVVTARRASEI